MIPLRFRAPFRLGRSIAPRADCFALPLSEYTAGEGGAMPAETVERKLVAILAADIAGFSRLVGADEVIE